ncbi:MAG: M15 family metallopeptidase [Desulfovibrio sp.]|jgi:hypothetical protein|nr:M15 family metallopeptidase [Desulfovibrio sp.]
MSVYPFPPRRYRLAFGVLFLLFLLWLVGLAEARQPDARPSPAPDLLPAAELPADAALDLSVLRAAYPGAVLGMARGASGMLELVMADGARLAYDDGKPRTPAEAEERPDVRTMLAQVYPLGPVDEASARPAPHFSPGRHRVQAFFLSLYGKSEAEARKNCRSVRFDGHGALMQGRYGAADALERVWKRLEPQMAAHPEWAKTLRPFGGAFCWRSIAATDRLSAHSFGVAVDLNSHLPYWLGMRNPEKVPAQVLAFPREIVAAFEAEGFIWGGKWAEFDLMHFEYRPELILKAKALRGEITLPR